MLAWSRVGATLAVGTSKGNLQLFHTREKRSVPVLGKHTKRVVCGTWSHSGVLGLASLDRTVRGSGTHVGMCSGTHVGAWQRDSCGRVRRDSCGRVRRDSCGCVQRNSCGCVRRDSCGRVAAGLVWVRASPLAWGGTVWPSQASRGLSAPSSVARDARSQNQLIPAVTALSAYGAAAVVAPRSVLHPLSPSSSAPPLSPASPMCLVPFTRGQPKL
jgi:hypothetical protein